MNEFSYAIKQTRTGAVIAYLRTPKDGELKPLLGKGGHPRQYADATEALHGLLENITAYMNGHLVRDGEIAGQTAAEAESFFKPVVRQKGKTRVISVAYKKGTFGCRAGGRNAKAEDESSGTPTKRSTSPGFSG